MLLNADWTKESDNQPKNRRNALPEGCRESQKSAGVVYTPKVLSDYLARKVTKLYIQDQQNSAPIKKCRILDPACGKGELLESMWYSLRDQFSTSRFLKDTYFFGIDIDKRALQYTYDRMRRLTATLESSAPKFQPISTNSLFPFNSATSLKGWTKVRRKFDAASGFDIIIANPPWGADISAYSHRLCATEFTMFRGQFDSSDLFLESAIANLRQGGYLAFIVPDSLFSQERVPLRKLLLCETEIRFIGRLGEKFFGKINRACAVIICRKPINKSKREVQCLRLTPIVRRKILSGELEFDQAEKQLSHFVNPSRFIQSGTCQFNIDLTSTEENLIRTISSVDSTLRDHLVSSRGVELSKKGRVYQCRHCGRWAPYPKSELISCSRCGIEAFRKDVYSTSIVTTEQMPGYRPIIVGESVCRYHVAKRYWIDIKKRGICYKSKSIYESPKILVRKTGVGLSVAIDYTNTLTNQVVYIFRAKNKDIIPLEFYLGLLASRVVYYYLLKTHGETEWRSHPYVTQRQILQIPVPSIERLRTDCSHHVNAIVRILGKYKDNSMAISNVDDAAIEQMVAGVYGLQQRDYMHIFRAIYEAEDLVPVRALKLIDIGDVFASPIG